MVPSRFRDGTVVPAHPLALTEARTLDERRQRALTRYYLDAGAGGLAVGVHTTQFAIHDPTSGLLEPVLGIASDEVRGRGDDTVTLIAGVLGDTAQAVAEAELAASLGYHAVLLAPPIGQTGDTGEALLERARRVGEVLPLVGFYLQSAVGGPRLDRRFWARFAALESVVAIKVAPFDRYQTLDVLHGVADSGRACQIALYTGNDNQILPDLLTRYTARTAEGTVRLRFVGGLLGQWSMWTRRAVELHRQTQRPDSGPGVPRELLDLDPWLTDANGAIFDAANRFLGCIPGTHEILRRHGLLAGRWCLDEHEDLSPGQLGEIDRIWAAYPELRDDDFIDENRERWLS